MSRLRKVNNAIFYNFIQIKVVYWDDPFDMYKWYTRIMQCFHVHFLSVYVNKDNICLSLLSYQSNFLKNTPNLFHLHTTIFIEKITFQRIYETCIMTLPKFGNHGVHFFSERSSLWAWAGTISWLGFAPLWFL